MLGPESILPVVVMDSGLAQERALDVQLHIGNDGRISIRDTSENGQRTTDNKTGSSDLPVRRFVDRRVQPSLQKYFASVVGRNISMSLAIPSHTEGRFAIVTDVGTGCGGRGSVLRAMGLQGGFFGTCERSPAR